MSLSGVVILGLNISLSFDGQRDCSFILENVEALATDENPSNYNDCLAQGGNWNMASVCIESGFESTTCKISGQISAFGITFSGSYEKGKTYSIPWARYQCQTSADNCCVKQGLYSGDQKLA